PVSFAAAICGLAPQEVLLDFGDSVDAACAIDAGAAETMGLARDGELVSLSIQDFVSVELQDRESRVQMPVSLAARHCGIEEGDLADDAVSVRQVACELSPEQAAASGLPGLG